MLPYDFIKKAHHTQLSNQIDIEKGEWKQQKVLEKEFFIIVL